MKQKPKPTKRRSFLRSVVGGAFNLTEDALVGLINAVPDGYPKSKSMGQTWRRRQSKQTGKPRR